MAVPTVPADAGDARSVLSRVRALGAPRLDRLRLEAQRLLDEDGVTHRRTVDGMRRERRWRLDPVPLVLDASEWEVLRAGVEQRSQLLDLVLADLHGPRRLLTEGLLPPEVVLGHAGFLRPLDGVRLPGFHQLTICATDLVRDDAGNWRPVSDRTATPSGAGYALQNRSVTARLLPDLQREASVERLAPYVRALRQALRAAAPGGHDDPRIAVLTPGTQAETAFEHAHVAGLLGYPLVEGRDLRVRDGRLWLRTVGGRPEPLDVLLRRVDAAWCDPLELHPDSAIGTPGLVHAVRDGGLSVVNGLTTGVLENPALVAHLPALSHALLGQDLQLEQPRTLWCGDHDARREVLANLDRLVCKPLDRAGDDVMVDGARLSNAQRDELRARIEARPDRWVGQERLEPAPEPALTPEGRLELRPVVLRTFTVAHGDEHTTMRGGLTRVGDGRGVAITNVAGAWSKDTWVLGADPEPDEAFWLLTGPRRHADPAEQSVPARTAGNLLWLGRYAERAESTVRILRAVDDRRADRPEGMPALDDAIDRLLRATTIVTGTWPGFSDADARATPEAELSALVLDGERAGTLAHDVRRLVDAAQAVREQLSGDTWTVLASLERDLLDVDDGPPVLAHPSAGSPGSRAGLGRVLTALLALQGLGSESLVRDASWRFLEVGRRLERGLQLLALLRATLVEPADRATSSLLLESVLTAAESLVTYRRRYRSHGQVAAALELLLADGGNPRSLAWQLERLVEELPRLPGHPGPGQLTRAEERVHAAGAALRTADLDSLAGAGGPEDQARDDLARLLDHLVEHVAGAATALEAQAVPSAPSQRPMTPVRPGDRPLEPLRRRGPLDDLLLP